MAARTQQDSLLIEEVAEFLASCPTREQFLSYRPSAELHQRVHKLIEDSKASRLTDEEEWELNQFEYVEMLMQLVKARLRTRKARKP